MSLHRAYSQNLFDKSTRISNIWEKNLPKFSPKLSSRIIIESLRLKGNSGREMYDELSYVYCDSASSFKPGRVSLKTNRIYQRSPMQIEKSQPEVNG